MSPASRPPSCPTCCRTRCARRWPACTGCSPPTSAPEGITVNNLLTGSILTDRNRSYWAWLAGERGETVEETTKTFHEHIPLRRQGLPEEMAAVAVFLCSQQAARITGQSIPIDGGISRHL